MQLQIQNGFNKFRKVSRAEFEAIAKDRVGARIKQAKARQHSKPSFLFDGSGVKDFADRRSLMFR